jgi:hypothetical protein
MGGSNIAHRQMKNAYKSLIVKSRREATEPESGDCFGWNDPTQNRIRVRDFRPRNVISVVFTIYSLAATCFVRTTIFKRKHTMAINSTDNVSFAFGIFLIVTGVFLVKANVVNLMAN